MLARDSNYDKYNTSYAFHRKASNTHKIYLLRQKTASIVLFTTHFLIHSLKNLMKSWQTLIDSGLNLSTNTICATRLDSSMFGAFTSTEKNMKLGLQNTSNVTLKSLVFPSPCKLTYAIFECCNSVGLTERKDSTETSLKSPFCLLLTVLDGI